MKYPYIVNKDGVWYPAGTEVPEDTKIEKTFKIVKTNKEDDFSQYMTPPTEDKTYTKTEINRLSTAELKDLAKENGIDDSLNGGELKKLLIEKFGL